MKRPSFQFYPSDWMNDPALKACSDLARLLWIEVMCMMHNGSPYGYLTLPNGSEIDQKMIKKLSNFEQKNAKKIPKLVSELIENGVLKKDEKTGFYFSKRMVEDERIRTVRGSSGRLGGNPNLLNQNSTKAPTKAPSKSQPLHVSSSSSSSSSCNLPSSLLTKDIGLSEQEKNSKPEQKKKKIKTQISESFDLTEELIYWGEKSGFVLNQLKAEVPKFVDYHKAKAESFLDWEAAFRTWMRNAKSWGKLEPSTQANGTDWDKPAPWMLEYQKATALRHHITGEHIDAKKLKIVPGWQKMNHPWGMIVQKEWTPVYGEVDPSWEI